MAEVVSFATVDIDNVLVDVYTVPADKSAIVFSLAVCNKDASARLVDVKVVKAAGAVSAFLAFAISVQPGQTIFVLGDNMRQGLMEGDKIQARATTGTNVLDVIGSALEEDV
jgi:hypothetical protein